MRLIALGGLTAVIRWVATGYSDDLLVLVFAQALHAFTFGAAHLGAIHFIAHQVKPSLSASAQSLYSTAVMGLGMGLSVLLASELYSHFHEVAFYAMAFISGIGSILAYSIVHPQKKEQQR